MFRSFAAFATVALSLLPASAEPPAKIDFARDVQPIFRQNCIVCHGPQVQNNGLRLDRRSSVLKPGARRIIPGSLENSFLYRRITGSEFGLRMPPTGPLKDDQIAVIKAWIEQGAPWPDALANEIDLPPLDPKAIALVQSLRTDLPAFEKAAAANPALLNARGPEGSTPFMYAVPYTTPATLERLLKLGADPNRHNDAGATALMWAAVDLEKTRVLIAHGANVNAHSDDARTPLMVAAGKPGNSAAVKLLLEHGANPNPNKNPGAESSPLWQASLAGDAESMRLLLDHGAAFKDFGGYLIANAYIAGCSRCIDPLVARNLDAVQYTYALQTLAVVNDPKLIRMLLDYGADPSAADDTGRTPLMYAAVSDIFPVEPVKMMLAKGAAPNAKSSHPLSAESGLTALDIARLHGSNPVADLLVKSGSTAARAIVQPVSLRTGNTLQAAISASLPLLQRTDASFMPKAGCFSCHNDSLAAMAVGLARQRGFAVNEELSARHLMAHSHALAGARERLRQGFLVSGINAGPSIVSFALMGLYAEHYPADLSTDAVAMYLQSQQEQDGHWAFGPDTRPPLCSALGQTVIAMRAIQLYPPPVDGPVFARSVQIASHWIAEAQPQTNYDQAWRLLGLSWSGQHPDAVLKARAAVLALQRADGGWSDVPSMESGAFTTGLTMIALESSGLSVSDPAYQRGVRYLLDTQLADGSWHVRSRAAGFQPYFDNGFPHGVDQWISAAGTSFATMALTLASPSSVAVLAKP